MSIVSNNLKIIICTVIFTHPCTRVDTPSDVWVEDVINMSVEGLVIDAWDDVVEQCRERCTQITQEGGVIIDVDMVASVSNPPPIPLRRGSC